MADLPWSCSTTAAIVVGRIWDHRKCDFPCKKQALGVSSINNQMIIVVMSQTTSRSLSDG